MPVLRSTRLTVTFEGFHQPVPSLSLPVGPPGQRGAELFRDRVTDHLLRHMRSLRQDRVRVVGHPDSPEGSVEVDGGGAPVQVGRFRVAPSTPDDGAQVQAGVPAWVWVVAVLVLAVLLF